MLEELIEEIFDSILNINCFYIACLVSKIRGIRVNTAQMLDSVNTFFVQYLLLCVSLQTHSNTN